MSDFFSGPIDKGVSATITTTGTVTVKALDKLLEILVLIRNNWSDHEYEKAQKAAKDVETALVGAAGRKS